MFKIFETSKYVSLLVACFMTINQGSIMSFNAWENKLKDTFNMSQTQVEIIGSVQNLGMETTFIGGIALEKQGNTCTGLIALATGGVAYIFNLIISYHPENFNGTIFILLVILYLFIGIGVGTTYIHALTISLKNLSCSFGGKILAVFAISIYGSTSLISWLSSSSNVESTTFMITFTVVHIFSSLLGLFCMREVTSEIVENDMEPNDENNDDKTQVNQKDGNSEKISLTSNKVDDEASFYGDKCGLGIMNITDFWLLSSSFILSIATDKTFFMNIGTYLRSFGQEDHLTLLTATGPLMTLATKLFIGPVSDAVRHKVCRIWFFIIPAMFKFAVLIVFLFLGDNFCVMLLTTYITYFTMGAMFLSGPVLFGEYFGLKYYGRNFGTVVFATGVVTVILHVLLGLSYDGQIKDKVTCLGLHCYCESTSILIALTFVTLCTSLALWKRTPPCFRVD